MARIPITDEICAELKAEKERTGVGSINLLGKGKEPPTYATLECWLSGRIKTAEKEHLDFVLEKWKALPDNPYIPITKEIQAEFKRKLNNTSLTFEKVSEKSGVNLTTMRGWFGSSNNLKKEELERVLDALESSPQYLLADSVPERKIRPASQYPRRKEKSPQAPIPPEFLQHLERTGLGASALWQQLPPDNRPNLNTLYLWGKKIKKSRKSWIEAAMCILEDLPDKPPEEAQQREPTLKEKEGYISIPEELIEAIRDYMKKPGATYDGLIGSTPPQGVTRYLLNSWTARQTRTAKPENLAHIERRISLLNKIQFQ